MARRSLLAEGRSEEARGLVEFREQAVVRPTSRERGAIHPMDTGQRDSGVAETIPEAHGGNGRGTQTLHAGSKLSPAGTESHPIDGTQTQEGSTASARRNRGPARQVRTQPHAQPIGRTP